MEAIRPVHVHIGERSAAQPKMQARIITGVIAGLTYECLRLRLVAVVSYDTGADCATVRFHALQFDLHPVLLGLQIVS